mgnify:CR=1 FL=1
MTVPKSAFGPPTATPATDKEPRCRECNRMLARLVTRPWIIQCPRCKTTNSGTAPGQAAQNAVDGFTPTQTPSAPDRRSEGRTTADPGSLHLTKNR